MKRRSLLKSAAVLPAAAALPSALVLAQTPPPPGKGTQAPSAAIESLKIPLAPRGSVGQPLARFFTPDQFSALGKLGELFAPAYNGRPGAASAGAAEFLDFYVSKSGADRQKLYRDGLDRLNADARRQDGKPFAELKPERIAPILQPLTDAWTYQGPTDPFARFLVSAKEDLIRATVNSRAYATALASVSRSSGGVGYYWFPIE